MFKKQPAPPQEHQVSKKQKMDEDNLIKIFEEHGILFSTVLSTCMKSSVIMKHFFETNDSALLFFYFLAVPPHEYTAKADEIAYKAYKEVTREKRCFNIIQVVYQCACENIKHDVVPPTFYNIYTKEIMKWLHFDIWNTKDINAIPLNCILLCFFMKKSRYELSYLEYFYDRLGESAFSYTFVIYCSLVNKEPFLSNQYLLPIEILSDIDTSDEQFDFILQHVDINILWTVCAETFIIPCFLRTNVARFQKLIEKQDNTQKFFDICDNAIATNSFFFTCSSGFQFFKEAKILKDFLFYNNANPAYYILSHNERSTWESIKSEIGEETLIEEFKKHEKFYAFYMDTAFFVKMIENLPTREKRRYLSKSYGRFFNTCITENDLASARWVWNSKISTSKMRRKFWDNWKFLTYCIEKNDAETTDLFMMMYGNGYLDKKKEEEIYLNGNVRNAVDTIVETGTDVNLLLLFQKLSKNEMFLYALTEAVEKTSPLLHRQIGILHYLKPYITELPKKEYDKCTTTQYQIIQTTFKILLQNHRTQYTNDDLYEFFTKQFENEGLCAILKNNTEMLELIVKNHHVEIFFMLLDDPMIKYCYEEHHYFYKSFDIRNITKDDESAVRELNEYEQRSYTAVEKKYGVEVREIGASNILELIRTRLREEFESKNTIPFECINAPSLIPYFKNVHHTAWRFLASPNPLVDNTSNYLIEGGSYYDSYKDILSLYYLAAVDKTEPCIENFELVENREQFFFAELAGMNRAHNLDTYGIDDLERDKPSCYSGIKRRIVNSVPGNALSTVLQVESSIESVLDEEIPRIFAKKWATLNHEPFMQCFDRFTINATVTGEMYFHLEQMNLSNNEQNALFLKVLEKIDNIREIVNLKERLTPYPKERRSENLHVITFYKYFIALLN